MSSLQAMEAAGKALKWLRRAAPHQTSEPLLWRSINLLLDGLSEPGGPERALGLLNGFGLRLLEVLGWGLNLDTCVSCGKECPSEQSSWVNPERGGLVCRECGGGPIRLAGAARREMRRATQADQVMIDSAFTRDGLRVVDRALCAHMGPDPAADLGAGLK